MQDTETDAEPVRARLVAARSNPGHGLAADALPDHGFTVIIAQFRW
jgi:hypothetical protein